MKCYGTAIASLGVWVFLSSFIDAVWVGIVFGAITAIFGVIGAVTGK